MAILIDGFNLLYKIPEAEALMYENRLGEARACLLRILRSYNSLKKEKIIVFFDGRKNPSDRSRHETWGNMDIWFSHDSSADFLIKEYVKKSNNPRMITVVTSDNDILGFTSRFRAKTMSSENFIALVNKTVLESREKKEDEKSPDPSLSHDEIAFWERMFGGKGEDE